MNIKGEIVINVVYVIKNRDNLYYYLEDMEEGYLIKHSRTIGYASHFETYHQACMTIDSVIGAYNNYGEYFDPYEVEKVEVSYKPIHSINVFNEY